MSGTEREIEDFNAWLGTLPHTDIVFVPGNHDRLFENDRHLAIALMSNATVLMHEEKTVQGQRVFGSPWTPWFHDWAFNFRAHAAQSLWSKIQPGTDILVTHGPPNGIHDTVLRGGLNVGCPELLAQIQKVQPRLHVFGHIHEGYGSSVVGGVRYINASIMDARYSATNKAQVIDLY